MKAGFKTVASYNAELTSKHQEFYRKKVDSEREMRRHEETCLNRPENLDMKNFFEMVHTSVTLPAQAAPRIEQDEEGENDLEAELLAEFGKYSSDEEDESRVTNNDDKQNRRKNLKSTKARKPCSAIDQELVDLEEDDIVVKNKYAILVAYDGGQESEEDSDKTTSSDDEQNLGDIYRHQKIHGNGGTKRAAPQLVRRASKVSWIIGEVVEVQKGTGGGVRVKVFKEVDQNWYEVEDDSKQAKRGRTKPTLVEKYSVHNFLCAVVFNKTTHKHRPNKASSELIKAFLARENYDPQGSTLVEWNVEDITDHRRSDNGLFMEYRVKWTFPNGNSWEPIQSLSNCGELLRLYESKHLGSKTLGIGTRLMLSATPKLLSNHHQIEFFHFKGNKSLRVLNYFGVEDMNRLMTPSTNSQDSWVSSNILTWFISGCISSSLSPWVLFSAYSFTKFKGGISDRFDAGFVDQSYSKKSCKHWMIPINWSGYEIPR
jgi:hypothetical protein